MSYTPNESLSDISRGRVTGAEPFGAYGKRVASGAESNILWPDGPFALPPAAGLQMLLYSTSPNDTSAGTGIRTVKIPYLDNNLAEQSETVTLNGTITVTTVATNIRFIQDMNMITYGSGKSAAGTIVAAKAGQNYAQISSGGARSSSSMRMVPAGKRLIVDVVFAGSSNTTADAATIVEIVTSKFDGTDYSADSVFIPIGAAAFQANSAGTVIPCPLAFEAGTAFGMRFETDKAATIIGFWSGRLENA